MTFGEVHCPACGRPFQPGETTVDFDPARDPGSSGPVAGPRMLAHYRILRPLGRGGMGQVYLGHDTQLGREVAVKVLPEAFAADRRALERLRREARTASGLNHPHIATVHDLGDHEGQPFVVMELVEGRTLRELIAGGARPRRGDPDRPAGRRGPGRGACGGGRPPRRQAVELDGPLRRIRQGPRLRPGPAG